MVEAQLLTTLGLMIIGGALLALLAKWLKQPILLGYVIAGFLIGPAILHLADSQAVSFVSEFGLIFLMFIIGLELDLSKLKDVGKLSALIGTIQVTTVTAIAAVAALVLGFTLIQGVYLGLVISFSSTLVVVKILTDIHEIDSLHGELALGILVIQDVLAVIGLSLLGTLGSGTRVAESFFGVLERALHVTFPTSGLFTSVTLIVNLVLFALLAYLFAKRLMPRVFKEAVSSSELLFVVTLGVVFLLSAIAGFFEFSLAMGAFLAGITLSTAAYSHEILGRVKPLKDFFLILFFVGLGMQVSLGNAVSQFRLVLLLIVGSLVLKPLVTFFALKLFKYNSRTAFLTSIHLAQIGEFGMVLIASGIAQESLPPSILTGVLLVTILTMMLTAYVIKYDEGLYQLAKHIISPLDSVFGTRPEEHRNVPAKYQPEVVIMGVNSMTAESIEQLHKKKRILVVDYNPARVLPYKERGIPTICSDVTNVDLYESIDFAKTETVISVVHQHQGNLFIIKTVNDIARRLGSRISMIASAATEEWGKKLYRAGATLVLIPDVMGRRTLAEVLAANDPATVRNVGRVYHEELHKNFVYVREL